MGDNKNDFSDYWRSVIEGHMNCMIQELFAGQDCVFISLQEILKERLQKR